MKLAATSLLFFFFLTNVSSQDITETSVNNLKSNEVKVSQSKTPYDFNRPQVLVLGKELMEVSGLAYESNEDIIIAHNDEKGIVYELSKTDGTVISALKFGKKADYESIECFENYYVICSSSGKLHFYNRKTKQEHVIKTKLTSKNDIEGMCLSPDRNLLLLACKGQSKKDPKSKQSKTVYAYNIELESINDEPYLLIEDGDLKEIVNSCYANETKSKKKKLIKRAKDFSPSGIDIHPITGEYYLVSAKGSTVIILSLIHI